MTASRQRDYPTLAEATRVWARIALLSFGGPAGQIAVMHRILVEEKRWLGDGRFLHALNFCMLLPGPEAQQLATYIGWLMHRTWGGVIAGVLFVLPGVVAIMALSWLYVLFGQRRLRRRRSSSGSRRRCSPSCCRRSSASAGERCRTTRCALIAALVLRRDLRLRRAVPAHRARGRRSSGFSARAPGSQAFAPGGGHGSVGGAHVDDAETLLGEEMAAMPAARAARRAPRRAWSRSRSGSRRSRCSCSLAGPGNVFADIATFFSKMAVVTFGGAYAVLAYVAQEAVGTYGWLEPGEMLDGLGMAETTPGPLIMVLQFVGFLAAFREAGWELAAPRRHPRRPPRDLGHLRALLRLDLPRRALHGGPARQPRPLRRPDRGDAAGRRRDPEPRDLVRDPRRLRRTAASRPGRSRSSFPSPVRSTGCGRALGARAPRRVPLKLGMATVLGGAALLGLALWAVGASSRSAPKAPGASPGTPRPPPAPPASPRCRRAARSTPRSPPRRSAARGVRASRFAAATAAGAVAK